MLLLKDGVISEWNNESNTILQNQNVNCGVKLTNGKYAIGSISGGLFILDSNGKILNQVNQHNGLENNTILSITKDNQDNLWIGLDNGIAHIIINSPLHYRVDKKNIPYSIYSVVEHNDYCYLATNTGVLYTKQESAEQINLNTLNMLNGINDHIWKLAVVDGDLLCGSNSGLYATRNNEIIKISDHSGVTDFSLIRNNEDKYLIASTYNQLIVLKQKKGKWYYSHAIDGFSNTSRLIEIDNFGYVWLSHEVKGMTRLELNDTNDKIISSRSFGRKDGLPSDYHLDIFKANKHIVISTDNGFYTFDYINDKIIPFDKLNNVLSLTGRAASLVPEDKHHFWVVVDHKISLIKSTIDSLDIERTFILDEHFSLTDKFQSLSTGGHNTYFCLDNGYAMINKDYLENASKDEIYFTKIQIKQSSQNQPVLLPLNPKSEIKLKKGKSNINFTFNNTHINTYKPQFQYKLNPSQHNWIDIKEGNTIAIENLEAGTYQLSIRLINENGDYSQSVNYSFTILPLLLSYTSIPISLFFIIVIVVLISVFAYKIRATKINVKHNRQLEKKEQLVESLKEEMKRKELENLENQLTLSTNEILKRDEAIGAIKSELSKTYAELKGRFPQKNYKRILETIDQQITNNEQDRANFEQHFMASQYGFYENLKKDYPNLTSSELRLCALLKMNLSSKEISSYLNITHRSVEVSRYRLRKKLKLSPEDNLVELLIKY
jgi:DNA-binding CsgD family transcriptional regulator